MWRVFRALRLLRVFRVQVLPKKRCTSVLAPMSVVSSYWDLQGGSSSYLFGKVNNLESMLVGMEEKPMCLV